jgi:hypothetical protein
MNDGNESSDNAGYHHFVWIMLSSIILLVVGAIFVGIYAGSLALVAGIVALGLSAMLLAAAVGAAMEHAIEKATREIVEKKP